MTMYQGNWKCSSCGGDIKELPFEPRSEKGLTCRTCWSKQKDKEASPAPETDNSTMAPQDTPEDAGLAGEPMPDDGLEGPDATPAAPGEKPKFEGDWTCSVCGGAITSLPFSPRNTSNLKCIDCFKQSKG